MALEQLTYGKTLQDTPAEIAKERSQSLPHMQEAADKGAVQRVNYNGTTVEIGTINHEAMGRPVDKQFERNRASVEHRLRTIGVETATVVNFLPIGLRSDSTLDPLRPTKATIPAPKDGQRWSVFSFEKAHIEPTRQGVDSPLIAFEFHPIQLAHDFDGSNPKGVFVFKGIPSDLEDESWLRRKSTEEAHHGMTYGEALKAKETEAIVWMQERLREGNESDRQKRNPSEVCKASARRLFHLGRIKTMPSWVEKQFDVNKTIPTCPKCQRPSEPGACQCTNINCGYIIDPKRAYEIGAIGEDDLSLERLTRGEVTAMGISDYVAETVDEKKERLKTGGQKKLSVAAQRLQETNDEIAAYNRQQDAKVLADALKNEKKGKAEREG